MKAEHVWTQKADMPTPRRLYTSAVVNGNIYVIGGLTSEPDAKALSTVEEYDPISSTWTRKTDMPIARTNMVGSSALVDGKIYIIGGDDNTTWGSPTVYEYDPATDTWTRKADMPTPTARGQVLSGALLRPTSLSLTILRATMTLMKVSLEVTGFITPGWTVSMIQQTVLRLVI